MYWCTKVNHFYLASTSIFGSIATFILCIFNSHCFVTEMTEDSNMVHTHKVVRGQNPMEVANYGLNLAKKLSIPETVLEKAQEMVRQLKTDEKGQLSITEEDVQALNCLKLVMTLKKIALNEEMDKGEKLEMVKNLQMQFCQTDSDTEMAE